MKNVTKKLLSILAASAIAVSMLPASFAANDDIKVIVDGTELVISEEDTKPFVEDGRTLVPMRAIFEALGATVEWDDATKTVTGVSDSGSVEMQVGSDTIKINGNDVPVDVPAQIVDGRTVVPVRVISEGLNCDVDWSQETKTVIISSILGMLDYDPLSLWTDDAQLKVKLTNYIDEITDITSDKYIPEEDRVAVFDFDGTLFCETDPNYFDYCLLKYRVLDDPEYKDKASDFEKEVANKIKEQNETGASFKGLEVDHGKAVASAFKGMTNAEFNDYIQEFKKQPMPSYEGMTRGGGYYKPMLEVVDYLKANDFDVYVVSGTDRFIVRGIIDNSPLELLNRKIIGSDETLVASGQGDSDGLDYTFTGDDKLVTGGEFIIKNLKMNKVSVIMQEIGQQPVLSFGNSTGDSSMAKYVTTNNPYESLAFMLCCDDIERENGNIEKADKMFDLCETNGWVPVSMKNDWTTIYGDEVVKVTNSASDSE
ncbi:MAG: haloacid dehalogenase-like hydrolase [Clostridia bacterium]|nr:haloacid dehalogenase-like hydrolase [Clostridia bacterium]